MKACLPYVFLALMATRSVHADDATIRFPYSAESAHKINESVGGGYEFYKAVGDATGPFAQVGYVEVNASGLDRIWTFNNGQQLGASGGIDDPNVEFLVHFFVDAKGGSFAVVHKRPVPDPVPIARDEMKDPRVFEQIELSGAATMAIWNGNLPLLELLLETGLEIDEPLDWDDLRWTALHYAARHSEPEVVRFLLDRGAKREVRDKYGELPISYAIGKLGDKRADQSKVLKICEMLRKPETDVAEEMISGYPRALLFETFFADSDVANRQVRFLSLNGGDPDPKLLEMARKAWRRVEPRSHCVIASDRQRAAEKGETSYRDTETGEYGEVVELTLKAVKSKKDQYEWSHRVAVGEFLAGGGVRGNVEKKFGYWIRDVTVSWDE